MKVRIMEKGQKESKTNLEKGLKLAASFHAEKCGILLMKQKTVTGQFERKFSGVKFEISEDGKTPKTASREGRSAQPARSATSRGSITKSSTHGNNKGQGSRSRRPRTSGCHESVGISLSKQISHLIPTARKCYLTSLHAPLTLVRSPNWAPDYLFDSAK